MTAQIKITIALVIVLVLAAAAYFIFQSRTATAPAEVPVDTDFSGTIDNSDNEDNAGNIVGGDQDEHGCIGSAGYSWCAPKNRCLRIWEEECYASLQQEIQYLLAEKYDRPADEVRITVTKQTENHAAGSVLFGQGGPGEGGVFLAAKMDNIWQVVFDGNGSVDCDKMRQEYGFPDEILQPNFCD